MFKKIISILLILIMVLSLSACNKQDANSDITSGTSDIASTETNEENKETESTPETDNTESGTEGENPQNSTPTKPTESNTTTTNNKPTTTTKPSNTEQEDESTNDKNDTPTTSTPTQKPTEKPYFVKFEYVNRTYAYPYYIDGVNLVNRLYGENYMQTNDTVTYRIVMSDGGTSGFKFIDKTGKISVNGNLVTISTDGTDIGGGHITEIGFAIETKDKNGNTVAKSLYYNVIKEDYCIVDVEVGMYVHLRDYAMSKGLKYYNGNELTGYTVNDETLSITNYNKKGADDYVPIKAEVVNSKYIFGNADWVKKVLWVIDKYAEMGFTKWSFDVIYLDGFATIAE